MPYSVAYGPDDNRKQSEESLGDIWPAYQRLIAEGRENVQIIGPDGAVQDPHQFHLNVVKGGVSVR